MFYKMYHYRYKNYIKKILLSHKSNTYFFIQVIYDQPKLLTSRLPPFANKFHNRF